MVRQARADFEAEGLEGEPARTVDMRYRGQGYELNVPWDEASPPTSIDAFHQLHRQSYGFADPLRPVEIVNLRLRMMAPGERYAPQHREPVVGDGHMARYAERDVFFDGRWHCTGFYRRDELVPGDVLHGPAMITEYTAATVLPPGDSAVVDGYGNLVVTIANERQP
jgi:N-methylhydantoinase A